MELTGRKGHLEKVVTEEMTARRMGSGELPVCATPAVLALAEETAYKSVLPCLEKGQGTVGTRIELAHVSATPVGLRVWCDTEVTKVDRRRISFSFTAFDESGKIAEGTHERFIVDNERFLAKAEEKKGLGK